ncbi:hypothetical protein K456DRAFT_1728208 [Colletotrichum gloeosporioides 23]|nr:hypothetical protein K456DRAFT_1728208 [Colletotrichum gloeosporioides 23]
MSRNTTLRVGDIEFIVDQAVCSQAVQTCDMPWFAFITRKSIGDQSGNNLRAAVEFVDASRASDPRDKIFGVLGLIDTGERRIAAAYSISFRHLVIGYYAYCLLTKKDISVMIQASSFRSPEGMPSWAPPSQYDACGSEHLIPSTGNLHPDWLCKSKDFPEAYFRHHKRGGGLGNGGFENVAWSRDLTRHTCYKVACEWINSLSGQVWFETCWHSQTAIDSSSGAFNLTAVDIMSFGNFDFSEAEIVKNGEVYVHTLKAGTSTLYIYANECIIGPADESDKIHLFALCDNDDEVGDADDPYRFYNATGKNAKSRLCVLQQINDEAKFRLLSASLVTNARQSWAGLDDDPKQYNQFFDPCGSYSRYPSPRLAFPTTNTGVVFLQVFQSILDAEKSGSSAKFFDVYFQAVREFHPQLIQWKSRQRNIADDSSHAQDRAIDVVQLRFEPNQHKILEDIFDMIQEDVKKSLEWPVPPAISEDGHHDGHFNPPFLRIGWSDLTLNQTNQSSDNSSADDVDVYGFYPLDAINEALDKEKVLEIEAMDEEMSGHGSSRPEAIHEDSVMGSSLGLIREHKGQTLWVAFDILSLTLWAQIHPYMTELRGLSRFCKDGENEMTRLLRPQTEEEERLTCLNWPVSIMEDFKIDGELRHITII